MSNFWNDKDRRRGAIGSIIVHIALLLLFIFFGLKYEEPKPEDGIVINFGNSATGMGNEADGAPQPQQSQPEEASSTPQESEPQVQDVETSTLTQDVVDAASVPEKSETKPKKEPVKEPVKKQPTPEELEQQRLERERAEKQRKLDAMLGKVESSKTGGEGVNDGPGDQGDPSGDPNSMNRTGGGGGAGGGGNYLLGGRLALNKPKPEYQCAEQGRVVVKIYVDRNGVVTRAIPGEKVPEGPATTTTSSCLFNKAKAAALKTTWQGDSEAPTLQIGYIIYNFQKS